MCTRFTHAALILGAALLLAGCTGAMDEESNLPNEAAGTPDPQAEELEPDAGDNASDVAAPAPSFPLLHNVTEEGRVGTAVSVDTIHLSPERFGLLGGHARWFPQEVEGTVHAANVTLEWSRVDHGPERLSLTVGPYDEDEGQWAPGAVRVQGPSPITLTATDLAWAGGDVVVSVWWADAEPAGASTAQPFTVHGALAYASGDAP